jgi:hypothetical protein
MRRQMEFETWTPEPEFLIGLAAAVYLSPCRQVVPVAERHTVVAHNHQTMVIK